MYTFTYFYTRNNVDSMNMELNSAPEGGLTPYNNKKNKNKGMNIVMKHELFKKNLYS